MRKSRNLVAYLSRSDRLKYLMSYEGGDFKFVSGRDLAAQVRSGRVSGLLKFGMMYAMDRYGNLYAVDSQTGKGEGKTGFFNHSSFCAGNEVICAGILAVNEEGELQYIDNSSGHYSPDEDALKRLLKILADAKVDLSRVRVKIHSTAKNYIGGNLLNGGKDEWPDAWNTTLKLAADIFG